MCRDTVYTSSVGVIFVIVSSSSLWAVIWGLKWPLLATVELCVETSRRELVAMGGIEA